MDKNIEKPQYFTYAFIDEDSDYFYDYQCEVYLFQGRTIYVIVEDEGGSRFLESVEQMISPTQFPTFFIEKFSSFDYYDSTKNDGIAFEIMYEDMMLDKKADLKYIGGLFFGECTMAIGNLGAFSDYFTPLRDYLENSPMWNRIE